MRGLRIEVDERAKDCTYIADKMVWLYRVFAQLLFLED
jgi:hypothetical protein